MLHSAEAAGNAFAQAQCHTMIAQLFNQTGQAEKGIVYSRKAVLLLDKITDPTKKTKILFLLSKRYLWHYQDTKAISSLDSSELFSRMQIEIARKTGNRNFIAKAYNNLQGAEFERGNFPQALMLLDSSFAYMDKTNMEDARLYYLDKADIILQLKNYSEAERFADSGLHYASLIGNRAFTADCYELISGIEKEKGLQTVSVM
jgi:hypothetical protein